MLLYYGSVIRIGDTFHMWYTGNYGPLMNHIGFELVNCCLCYATSKDGMHWEKPVLGLVDYKGSKQNNICELKEPTLCGPPRRFCMTPRIPIRAVVSKLPTRLDLTAGICSA